MSEQSSTSTSTESQSDSAFRSLGLSPEHFERWLALFEATARRVCGPEAALFFVDRAERIADSLQIGLNIGPKALDLGAAGARLENA